MEGKNLCTRATPCGLWWDKNPFDFLLDVHEVDKPERKAEHRCDLQIIQDREEEGYLLRKLMSVRVTICQPPFTMS